MLATRYGRLRGEPFPWVYLAESDLAAVAQAAGYTIETLMRVDSGEYLVALHGAPDPAESGEAIGLAAGRPASSHRAGAASE